MFGNVRSEDACFSMEEVVCDMAFNPQENDRKALSQASWNEASHKCLARSKERSRLGGGVDEDLTFLLERDNLVDNASHFVYGHLEDERSSIL